MFYFIKGNGLRRKWFVILVSASMCLFSGIVHAELSPARLRTNQWINPNAIDSPKPVLSWIVESEQRGEAQTAYRVLVASSKEKLSRDEGDLWDSSKIKSKETLHIHYEGRPLSSHQHCFWKVQVWDASNKPSTWSESAHWTMGILDPAEWQAKWIGYDEQRAVELVAASLEGAQWIRDEGLDSDTAPQGLRMYIKSFELPKGFEVTKAELLGAADNKYWLAINGKTIVHGESGWKTVKPVSVADVLLPGSNEIRIQVENSEPGPTGMVLKLTVSNNTGHSTTIVSDSTWRYVHEPGQDWSSRVVKSEEVHAVTLAGAYGCQPWGKAKLQDLHLPPVPRFRTTFNLTKPVDTATLYVTALGVAGAYLNGQRISDEFFTPGWTDYAKRVYYRGYDVTDQLRKGPNALGGELADGWYSGYIGWGQNRNHYSDSPRLAMQLAVQFTDGTKEIISTGPNWKAKDGPVRSADFLMGESYDARLEDAKWSSADYDDAQWKPVVSGAKHSPRIGAHPGPPVVAIQEFTPKSITQPRPGKYVFDLGQNFAGVVRLKISESAGHKIHLRFAERLNPEGTVYTTNLRGAKATDTYICRGDGVEEWTPRFTFHGFQYVEVTGLSKAPEIDTVTGIALSSDTKRVGQFECSNKMLNQLASNIYWTQRANFIDIPTDCPQRDERLGWTGDAQVYVATAALNTDVQSFFHKWLVDLTDAQRSDGQFPMVAPLKIAGDDGGPAWADAGVICPWTIYEVYGDRELLDRQYVSMKEFVEFCRSRSVGGTLPPQEFHCFGDWLSINAATPPAVIYTAYFADSARLLARAAAALGHESDSQEYEKLYQDIKQAFNKAYVDSDGHVAGNTQCGYVLALANDLLDGETKKRAAAHLIADIESRGQHLTTGFVGTKDLMLVLSAIDRNDVAYRLLQNETFPSWGFSIQHGATSIWERWDGWTPEAGFQDPGMNSFAHYSFGAVYQWMVENMGGIRRESAAYERIIIAPQVGGDITWAKVSYDSVRGPIACHWSKVGGDLHVDVTIPANTVARVVMPAAKSAAVTESGRPVQEADGVKSVSLKESRSVLEIGSGKYSFSVKTEE